MIIFSAAALASLALPMMSVYISDGEGGTILSHIFNLPEFSPLGFGALIAPLLLVAAAFIRFPQKWKRLTVIGIVIAVAICTATACKNAYVWLAEIGTESVKFHAVCVIYGFILIAAALIIALPGEKAKHND